MAAVGSTKPLADGLCFGLSSAKGRCFPITCPLKFGLVREKGAIKNSLKIALKGKQIRKSPDARLQKFCVCVCVVGFYSRELEIFRKRVPSPCSRDSDI